MFKSFLFQESDSFDCVELESSGEALNMFTSLDCFQKQFHQALHPANCPVKHYLQHRQSRETGCPAEICISKTIF